MIAISDFSGLVSSACALASAAAIAPMVSLDRCMAPCTLHAFGSGLIGRLAGRVGLPGATFCPLCHEYLGGTRAPAGWPRCKSSGELRLERQYRD
jgi:hypothetical protein